MIVIIKVSVSTKLEPVDSITGWMFGSDVHDLRRQCEGSWNEDIRELAPILYRMEFPAKGKHKLTQNFLMLVS